MKKIFLTCLGVVCLGMMSGLFAQNDNPQWLQALEQQNEGLIDSTGYYNADPGAPDTRTYIIYYNQPLEHAQPDGPHFHMRALITVPVGTDPTKNVNLVYCTGYALDKAFCASPDTVFKASKEDCSAEITHRYNANYISIEHRYFQYSAPSQCYTNLDPLRAEEASADFHNLFEGLKKVLKGKWVMSGVSKGGITTLLQHHFYPNDMDIFVPYSAPFFSTDRDTTMQEYWMTTGWTKEFRDMFLAVNQQGIYHYQTIYPIFYKMNAPANPSEAQQDSVWGRYINAVAHFGYTDHTYSDTATLRQNIYANDSILRSHGFKTYGDTIYAYMFDHGKFSLQDFKPWIDTLRKYPNQAQGIARRAKTIGYRPFGVTEAQWWGNDTIGKNEMAYEYQSKCELGYYDLRFNHIVADPTEAKGWNAAYKQYVGCLRDFDVPWYASLTFSRNLYDAVMASTQAATKPIVLIYGEDDTWTGAAVKDKFINGNNVRKFILPAQNHGVRFASNTDQAKCDAIRAILDGVLGAPQDIETVESGETSVERTRKILRDGQIYIIRGDKTYTLTGVEVR